MPLVTLLDGYRETPIDEATWCCRGCGYGVRGLLPRQRCPECGRPVDALDGTEWQHFGDALGYARTLRDLLTRPASTMRAVRPDPWRLRTWPLVAGHAVASGALAGSGVLVGVVVPWVPEGAVGPAWLVVTVVFSAACALATWLGVLWARLAGYRAIALPAAAHAGAAWVAAGGLTALVAAGVVLASGTSRMDVMLAWALAGGLALGAGWSARLLALAMGRERADWAEAARQAGAAGAHGAGRGREAQRAAGRARLVQSARAACGEAPSERTARAGAASTGEEGPGGGLANGVGGVGERFGA